jgi:hypothetical protein
MAEQRESERHLAMLIDGDNAQYSLLKQMIEEASRYGTVTIRRAYGDWKQPNLSNWDSPMRTHAVRSIHQARNTTGKNATDSALIIEAMDILHSGKVQGFCIVSSDSDFTGLCMRIREEGLFVMGIGRKETPEAFVNACNVFVHVENLVQPQKTTQPKQATQPEKPTQPKQAAQPQKPAQPKKVEPKKTASNGADLMNLLRRAFDILEPDDGWVLLSALGDALHRLDPSFDSRTYGQKTLSLLIKSLPELVTRSAKKTGPSAIYVRLKDS